MKLDLVGEDIAKLYGQGLTRGAVVWRRGMEEWRPLLITPELMGLLRRTRTTLADQPLPSFAPSDEVALPPPPRMPPELAGQEAVARGVAHSSIAPAAFDVAAPSKRFRPLEIILVGAAAFTLAWICRGALAAAGSDASARIAAFANAAAAGAGKSSACEPARTPAPVFASSIPTLAVSDLPLLGRSTSTEARPAPETRTASVHHAAATREAPAAHGSPSQAAPPRAALVAALTQVAGAAASCGERGGPVRLVVTFNPTGVARGIQVSGQDLPSATRSCIISAASRARVPAFTGDAVTVAKTL